MTRLGWAILVLILLVAGAFVSMLSFGPSPAPVPAPRVSAPAVEVAAKGLRVPVRGAPIAALRDNWGEARAGGSREHHAIDIMAATGTPVLATAPGTIEKLFDSHDGGHTIYQRSTDGGTVYYYAHLAGYRPGLHEGQAVRGGEAIGFVGATGNADRGAPHLHFEIKRMAPGERWWQGANVNPYPLLAEPDANR